MSQLAVSWNSVHKKYEHNQGSPDGYKLLNSQTSPDLKARSHYSRTGTEWPIALDPTTCTRQSLLTWCPEEPGRMPSKKHTWSGWANSCVVLHNHERIKRCGRVHWAGQNIALLRGSVGLMDGLFSPAPWHRPSQWGWGIGVYLQFFLLKNPQQRE